MIKAIRKCIIMSDEPDKEMERRSLKRVRYADDFSIYCSDGAETRKTGNGIYPG
jgi:hypothetical protein